MTLLESNARAILESALSDPIGILVKVKAAGDMVAPTLRAKQVLYRFKKQNADFDCLQILLGDDPDSELWIVKRQPETDFPGGFPQEQPQPQPDPNSDPEPIEVEI